MAKLNVTVQTRRILPTLWLASLLLKAAALVLRYGIQYRVGFGKHRGRWRRLPVNLEISVNGKS